MRYLRNNAWCRRVAGVLALLMMAPYLALPRPAQAQQTAPPVYVLDFNNRTNIGGALLGRIAAAQVALQLSDSPNWDVIPDAQVQRRIQELNLQPPFDRLARTQIASGVDATAVIYGNITEATVTQQPNARATVRIEIKVEDIGTGVLINGAVAEGVSTARMGFAGNADILLEEALAKAAFRARELMDTFRLPAGTVLNTTVIGSGDGPDLDALLNIGARAGVRRGMEMIVTRQGQYVAKLRVSNVDADLSTGRVIDNRQGVRPEDRVRAIFSFSDFPVGRARLRAMAAPLSGSVAPAGAKAGKVEREPVQIARADKGDEFVPFRGPQEKDVLLAQNTDQGAPPVVVDEPEPSRSGSRRRGFGTGALRVLVGGLLVAGILAVAGGGGENATRAHGINAFGFQQSFGSPNAFIKVVWDRPKRISADRVLQYIIWRTDSQGGQTRIVGALNTDASRQFVDSEAVRDVTAFDAEPGADDAGGRTTIADVPGIAPGVQYRYQIATAYREGLRDRDGDGVPDDGGTGGGGGGGGGQTAGDAMSPLSETTNFVTAIRPPAITGPSAGQQVQLDQLQVSWTQSPGADVYVIWLSRNPNFRGRKVQIGPFRVVPVNQGGEQVVTRTIDARAGQLAGSQNIYISVGARASVDREKPRPFGYIFSSPVRVAPETTPPGPPGGASASDADDTPNNRRGSRKRKGGINGNALPFPLKLGGRNR